MTTVSFEICLVIALYRIDVNHSIRPRCFFQTLVKKTGTQPLTRPLSTDKQSFTLFNTCMAQSRTFLHSDPKKASNIYFVFRLVYFIHYNVTVFTHFNLVHFILALSTFGQLAEVSLCLGGTLRGVLLLLPRVDRTDTGKKQD